MCLEKEEEDEMDITSCYECLTCPRCLLNLVRNVQEAVGYIHLKPRKMIKARDKDLGPSISI